MTKILTEFEMMQLGAHASVFRPDSSAVIALIAEAARFSWYIDEKEYPDEGEVLRSKAVTAKISFVRRNGTLSLVPRAHSMIVSLGEDNAKLRKDLAAYVDRLKAAERIPEEQIKRIEADCSVNYAPDDNDAWICQSCGDEPSLTEGYEVPEHGLCDPCVNFEVTRVRSTDLPDLIDEVRFQIAEKLSVEDERDSLRRRVDHLKEVLENTNKELESVFMIRQQTIVHCNILKALNLPDVPCSKNLKEDQCLKKAK